MLQGGIVSPNLFNHYLYDIGNYLDTTDGILMGETPVSYLLYADDLVLMSSTSDGLQRHINNLYTFCAAWHLIVSLPKTKVLIFTDHPKARTPKFTYGQETIDIAPEYKYLGLIFSTPSKNALEETVPCRPAAESHSSHVPIVREYQKLCWSTLANAGHQNFQIASDVSARIWS